MGINLSGLNSNPINQTNENETGITKVDRGNGAITLNLSKGISLDLTKNLPTLKKMRVGLGWDCYPNQNMDLDVFALLLHGAEEKITDASDVIYFKQKDTGKGIVLSGDNRTGEGDGDDEILFVNLERIPSSIQKVVFYANIYKASELSQNFGMVKDAYIRIVNEETGKEEAIYQLNKDGGLYTTVLFAGLKRTNSGWSLETYGEGTHGDINEIANRYM